jgi:hypothetical protein
LCLLSRHCHQPSIIIILSLWWICSFIIMECPFLFLVRSCSKIYFIWLSTVANDCNPSYSGGWDQENLSLRLAQTKSSQDPISKTTKAKKKKKKKRAE